MLGGGVRGDKRAGDCLRPQIGGARLLELAYFGFSAGGLRPARVPRADRRRPPRTSPPS